MFRPKQDKFESQKEAALKDQNKSILFGAKKIFKGNNFPF
jgi:hypothetical protein